MRHGIADRLRPRDACASILVGDTQEFLLNLAEDDVRADSFVKATAFCIAGSNDDFAEEMFLPWMRKIILR
jgi:hypothetical protein